MDEKVQAYVDGTRALLAWLERWGDRLHSFDVTGPLGTHASTVEAFREKVSWLEGDYALEVPAGDYVRARRQFGGGISFYVSAPKAVVVERDDRTELREVQVGEWRLVAPLADLGPLPTTTTEGG